MIYCIVRGRVQGVGYRYSALSKARSLALYGWVRNVPDDSVETKAWGTPSSIDAYLEWLYMGSPFANVSRVSIVERIETDSSPYAEFRIEF